MNVIAWAAMGFDKAAAQRGWRRVPEARLLLLVLLGGGLGAKAAQRVFRHKTRKEPFRSELNVALVVGAALLLAAVTWPHWIGPARAAIERSQTAAADG